MKLMRFDSSIIQSDLISIHVYGKYYLNKIHYLSLNEKMSNE